MRRNQKLTLVIRTKFIWFIRLRIVQCSYEVCILDPTFVGCPGFNRQLVSFLDKARRKGEMKVGDRSKWEIALVQEKSADYGGPQGKPSDKRSAKKMGKSGGSALKKGEMSDQSGEAGASLIDEPLLEHKCLSIDEYGVVVPFLNQINEMFWEVADAALSSESNDVADSQQRRST